MSEDFESDLHEQLSQQQEALREVEEALKAEANDNELLEVPPLCTGSFQPVACPGQATAELDPADQKPAARCRERGRGSAAGAEEK